MMFGGNPVMKTLYVKIIVITMAIMIASALVGFVVSNIYYHYYLKPQNDEKVTHIASNIVDILERDNYEEMPQYLSSMTDLGYQFYLVDESGNGTFYGEPFRKENITGQAIQTVINDGDVYHGIEAFPWKLFITGFFNNELKNTVGVPVTVSEEKYALFVRQSTSQQFGEMRIFLAMMLIFILIFSFLLVLISTRFIVNPIKHLTEATKKIAAGNYHIKLNSNRRDEIGRLASNFSIMSDSLEKTEEKRQAFVSNVSHEIQSPLTSIQGFSQALREETLSESDRDHYLSIIEQESRRLSLLSKQLLTLSFLDSQTEHIESVSYNLLEQLKEVISVTKWDWQKKDIAIELNVRPELKINGDPKLLHQVWANLLTNAIRYTEPEGLISIEANENRQDIEIIFKDTGIGISTENLSQIFERFYIVDQARTRTHTSTGLGLAITKKIIEIHDGSIMVESELNKGSTFTVTLPKH